MLVDWLIETDTLFSYWLEEDGDLFTGNAVAFHSCEVRESNAPMMTSYMNWVASAPDFLPPSSQLAIHWDSSQSRDGVRLLSIPLCLQESPLRYGLPVH